MSDFALFDHFQYAEKIVDLVESTFPTFHTVVFVSNPGGDRFSEVSVAGVCHCLCRPGPDWRHRSE